MTRWNRAGFLIVKSGLQMQFTRLPVYRFAWFAWFARFSGLLGLLGLLGLIGLLG
jgi:hypothetical protein